MVTPKAPKKDDDVSIVVNKPVPAIVPVTHVAVLTAENVDHVATELAAAVLRVDPENDTYIRERLDHQRTLAAAVGIHDFTTSPNDDELRETAQERNTYLRSMERNKASDAKIEAVPATWNVLSNEDGQLTAVNRVTGKEFSGATEDFFKR